MSSLQCLVLFLVSYVGHSFRFYTRVRYQNSLVLLRWWTQSDRKDAIVLEEAAGWNKAAEDMTGEEEQEEGDGDY